MVVIDPVVANRYRIGLFVYCIFLSIPAYRLPSYGVVIHCRDIKCCLPLKMIVSCAVTAIFDSFHYFHFNV